MIMPQFVFKSLRHCRRWVKVSERRACQVLGKASATQGLRPPVSVSEARLVARIIELATVSDSILDGCLMLASATAAPLPKISD